MGGNGAAPCLTNIIIPDPANTRRWSNVSLLLGRRSRRRANGKPTLVQRLMFAGKVAMLIAPNLEFKNYQSLDLSKKRIDHRRDC